MKICLVCTNGGHLTQMRELEPVFEGFDYFFLTHGSSRTKGLPRTYLIPNFASRPWLIPYCFIRVLGMMIVERPDMIVTTGAEIAIPAFVIGRLMRAKTLFLESAARVTSTSRTGRILYHVSDFFFVQWPSNRSLYGPKAVYKGGLL